MNGRHDTDESNGRSEGSKVKDNEKDENEAEESTEETDVGENVN